MTRRLLKPIPDAVISAQRSAAAPESSVWVEANAGSGKTHVLTQRVLRLLLAGVRPEEVLCLTYTKAAAAEMRKRVSDRLAAWALMADAPLRQALEEITGYPPAVPDLARARTLFAHALDTPGGLKILTIHAFCESVLHRFPVEAGVPFDFAVLEDFERQAIIQRTREAVIAEGLRGGANAEAVETLFGLMSDFLITEAIEESLAKSRPLRRVLTDKPAAKARLRRKVGHPLDAPSSLELRHTIETESLLVPGDCRELVRKLGGDPFKTRGIRFADALARGNVDNPTCDDLILAFITDDGKGKPRDSLMTAKERLAHPELFARFDAEKQRVGALVEALNRTRLIERSEALLDILDSIVRRYEAEKRSHSLLDFDDLIERAAALFEDEAQGYWVRYKLDAGITHILVDESQDTNAEQWKVVKLLAAEFFAGMSAVQRPRTVFAVGDTKQSIYSFQGANPALFGAAGDAFEAEASHVGMGFAQMKLTTSFRTLPNILTAVDKVFAAEDKQIAVLARDGVRHFTARAEGGGTVTLWPPLQATAEAATESDGWPLEAVDTLASAPRLVAKRIATEVAGWIRERRPLGPRGRAVTANDVLILVQTRSALFHEIIRELIAAGVPTPGADRLMVTTHIAILDLLALGDVLLNPADDLQLAALLRSPLFDLSEDELYSIAQPRTERQRLWDALGASPRLAAKNAYARLHGWRSRLDFERPYEFYAQMLYAEGGLKRFHGRFGAEADDLFAQFLELALEHEQTENPSLQGFLAAMRGREVTITRELGEASQGVRVMTVHGAKGLEAPIVILADAATKPQGRQVAKPVIISAEEGIFLHASGKKDHVPQTLPLREAEEAAQWAEFWRKLYVGMTRAEDELYVTGAFTPARTPESQLSGSWYEAIESALRPESEIVADDAGVETGIVFPAERPVPPPALDAERLAGVAATLSLGSLPPPVLVPFVRPSSAFEGKAEDVARALETTGEALRDAETARKEGIALHALLQHLGRLDRASWEDVAQKALAELLAEPSGADRARLAAKAISILTRPELQPIFGPGSRAEVPFLAEAQREGRNIKLAGRIDRLVVTGDEVWIVDFKSDVQVAADAQSVPGAYRTQLGLYALVAEQLFPRYRVRGFILWTALESLLELPRVVMAVAASGFTMR